MWSIYLSRGLKILGIWGQIEILRWGVFSKRRLKVKRIDILRSGSSELLFNNSIHWNTIFYWLKYYWISRLNNHQINTTSYNQRHFSVVEEMCDYSSGIYL